MPTILIVFTVVLFGSGAIILWASQLKIPDFDSFAEHKVSQSTKIYDRTGKDPRVPSAQRFLAARLEHDPVHFAVSEASAAWSAVSTSPGLLTLKPRSRSNPSSRP